MKRAGPELLWFLAYAVLAVVITAMFAREPGGLRLGNPRAPFRPQIEGTASKPYVRRALVPFAVRSLGQLVPGERRAELEQALDEHHPLTRVLDNLVPGWERDFAPEYVLTLVVLFLCLLGFAYALRYLATAVYEAPPGFVRALPVCALLALPPSFEPYASYPYDFAVLFLFTLALALMARRRFGAYLCAYAIACLNKETTILLTAIFYLHFGRAGRLDRRSVRWLLAAQLALFVAIEAGLHLAFADNPGQPAEFHLLRNLFKLPRYPLGFVAGVGLAAGLVFHGWRAKPPLLRTSFLMLVPLLALTFFLGFLDELRDYYEVYPAAVLLMSQTACGALGVELRPRAPAS